jgi:dinuclear metal center YbgI/SA1388 family protein
VTGALNRQLRQLFSANIALYGAHLPLDSHPLVGNNAQLATSLAIENAEPFFETKGQFIGLRAVVNVGRDELVRRLEQSLAGPVRMFAAGPAIVQQIGIVTGGAGAEIYEIAKQGIDTFITGEAPHWAAVAAEELGVNLLLGGHYATETFGVRALAAHVAEQFALPWEFIDAPTGL